MNFLLSVSGRLFHTKQCNSSILSNVKQKLFEKQDFSKSNERLIVNKWEILSGIVIFYKVKSIQIFKNDACLRIFKNNSNRFLKFIEIKENLVKRLKIYPPKNEMRTKENLWFFLFVFNYIKSFWSLPKHENRCRSDYAKMCRKWPKFDENRAPEWNCCKTRIESSTYEVSNR